MGLAEHLPEGFEVPEESSDGPDFWSVFWRAQVTPWDVGTVHPEFVRQRPWLGDTGRALVAGCGRGHDALYLAQLGFSVTAIDSAPEAAALAQAQLEPLGATVRCEDALALDEGPVFDLILEHTFLCALPLERRPDWADVMSRHLRPGGRLAALVFPVGKPEEEGGPPFGLNPDQIEALLEGSFRRIYEGPVDPTPPARAGGERFVVFERTNASS